MTTMAAVARRLATVAVALTVFGTPGLAQRAAGGRKMTEKPLVHAFKRSTCSCCNKWIEHLEANGFDVMATHVVRLEPLEDELGVPPSLRTCHTAVVDGYVIEGHVPADVIHRVLRERPEVLGIGVAGMPAGSPGMESARPVPYAVLSFDREGRTALYAKR